MKLLLCGENGRIGREIVLMATALNLDLVATSSSQLDITNHDTILSMIEKTRPDIVINAAGYVEIDNAETNVEHSYKVNKDGPYFLGESCKVYDIPLIHLSTDYVFSGNKNLPYTEEEKPAPINIYGMSKLAGEQAILKSWNKHIILRTSWIFGQYGHNFVKTILKAARVNTPITVVSNETGCPTSTSSLADCILNIAKQIYSGNNAWGIYHFCGSPAVSRYQYALEILEIAKKYYPIHQNIITPIPMNQYIAKAKRPPYSVMQVDKICHAFNIKPEDWRSTLIKIIPTLQQSDFVKGNP
jgi:dTDP-4-dehydrorhamnose reductase